MTQSQLNRAVARATGECLSTIRHRGFGLLRAIVSEPEREPLLVDWDALERHRKALPSSPADIQWQPDHENIAC
jgi:hypothetical protein